ncbi:hypothetical protein Tco_0150607 [Tanacetum coccineum]
MISFIRTIALFISLKFTHISQLPSCSCNMTGLDSKLWIVGIPIGRLGGAPQCAMVSRQYSLVFQAKNIQVFGSNGQFVLIPPTPDMGHGGGCVLGPEIIAHSIGMALLLRIITVPPFIGNFNIPCAVDGMTLIFLMPVLPIISLC